MQHHIGGMTARLRRFRVPLLIATDALAIVASYAALGILRYDAVQVPWDGLAIVCATALVVHFGVGWLVKLYRGRAIVASSEETVLLGGVAAVVSVLVSLINLLWEPQPVARLVPFGAAFASTAFMIVARAAWRRYAMRAGWVSGDNVQATLVVGAGDAGQQLVLSMLGTANSPYRPVAFLDDDPWRRHFRYEGVSVQGTLADLESAVEGYAVDTVVVAIPSAPSELVTELSDRCTALGVEVKVLPPVDEILGGRITIRDVRDINIADLLGRNAIETDISSVAHFLNGKRVLVTGAGGSIGSELARQISKWHPSELMMLDRDESGLHGVQLSIHGHALLDSPDVVLCDIRDADALNRIFDERRPEVVFHAAALKHLPMLEQYPLEAVKTNVIGTANVLEASRRVGVERFVNISTDKAADPTSVLGYSKRVAERLTADYARKDDGFYMSVRFGNVLGSRGSVLTTFAGQIAAGGPITVTHPDVTRYFMTIPEAVQLVLQAGAIGRDGEVLILDMGEPVKIDDVAKELIRQSGRRIEIVYTGLRDGEKMDEILRSDAELDHRPLHPLISHVQVEAVHTPDTLSILGCVSATRATEALKDLCDVMVSDSEMNESVNA
ncbi:polysaccharide biosynthesis protein [Nocardioides sambongensis]|uniref:polysaccharide biosynthesis protein n=1 Tax=Nocardioides sambongensis TaxID=2589074 RepID=UPI0018C87AE2|nr:nucleoside-diphosphate sugar epimerase/dehydratase [Nocardioides sambongensis]